LSHGVAIGACDAFGIDLGSATFGIDVRFDAFGISEFATISIDARFDAFSTSLKPMLFVAKTPTALLVSDRRPDTFGLEKPALLVSDWRNDAFSITTAIRTLILCDSRGDSFFADAPTAPRDVHIHR
jgi:hypothetical protein